MAERKIAWKPRNENRILGSEVPRIDGIEKASGYAKYTADINTPLTAYARLLTCPHGHAKLVHLDVAPARQIKGVLAVKVMRDVGAELRWDGEPIVAVAAVRPEIADDAIRAIRVEFEPLEHWVDEEDLEGAKKAGRTKFLGEQKTGDFEKAWQNAAVRHEGYYGIHTITHMCMETHGSHCEWRGEDSLDVHLSTQNVSGTAGGFAQPLGLEASKVSITCNYVGGGFGSKFRPDEWGVVCAELAKEAGRPVRLMLDRATELKIAGNRPSGFAKVKIAADRDGNITAFGCDMWGTNGTQGSPANFRLMPYVFTGIPNIQRRSTGIICNAGGARAWRAPNHPQVCALTCTAIDDLAAALGMDSYDVFLRNLDKTERPDIYRAEMELAAKLMDWKAKWHPHGKGAGRGPVRQGLGMAVHTWRGRAGGANCSVTVHPDGTVESFQGSQDIGTGTRTVIAITLAETFGIPLSSVKVHVGSNKWPASGASGGSTTVGGVSGPNRRAALEALWKIFDLVAARYGVDADSLEARDGYILSDGVVVCSFKQACSLIGPMPLVVQGQGPKNDGLTSEHVGGVQMADVSVDTETGVIRINKYVAVQDCGTIIDRLTAKSQVLGAVIMGIAYALTEERIMDNKTGRFINADLVNYKLPRIGDIGELIVEMYEPDSEYERGVVGLGEPPVISPGAAISNAVANALGVRVPVLPMTPKRVLDALKKGGRA